MLQQRPRAAKNNSKINQSFGFGRLRDESGVEGKLLYNTGSPAWHFVTTWRGEMGGGREAQEGGDIYIYNYGGFTLYGRNPYNNIVKQLSSS